MTNRELAVYCTAHWSPIRFLCGDCKYMNNICRVFRKKYGGESPYMLNVRFPQIYTDEEIPNQEDTDEAETGEYKSNR